MDTALAGQAVKRETDAGGSSMRLVLTACVLGTVVEWYDFLVYGTAAALVFNKLFFPSVDPILGTIAAFGTYAVGFVARPVGGAIFGHFGDRVGRKSMLMITMMVMGISTFLIGCLPTYADIGIWAPIALVSLRVIQGLGLGGEWGGASLMVMEYSPKERRGLYGALVQDGFPLGMLLSLAAFAAVSQLPESEFMSWGWRVPFLLSILLVFVGIYVRFKLQESPVFVAAQKRNDVSRYPVIETIMQNPRTFFTAVGLKLAESATIYVVSLFCIVYATTKLGLPRSLMINGIMIAAAVAVFTYPMFGALADRVGRRPFYIVGPIFIMLFAFPLFWMMDTREPAIVILAMVLGVSFGQGMMFCLQSSYFPELFGTRIRYTGASLGFQVASTFAGGLSPIISTSIFSATQSTTGISLYMIFLATLSLIAGLSARETLNEDIT